MGYKAVLLHCLLFLFTTTPIKEVDSSGVRLFVFGDSYVDTGNCRKSVTGSWKEPYGITFPGKPAGRFSDGRVLTDYIASFFNITSPVPYQWRNSTKKSDLKLGMNFAYGGTGVFDTLVSEPNMTTQINYFQQLVEEKVYTKQDLTSSIAVVSAAGNDYGSYVVKNGKLKDLPAFTKSIMDQLVINLKLIHSLGVRKIAVTALEPVGCLPQLAAYSSYHNCSEDWNSAARFHNQLLKQSLEKLNSETKELVFSTLDLYGAFTSVLNRNDKGVFKSNEKPLEPCCVGETEKYACGSTDENGTKKYIICKNPQLSFFWDNIHPSQNGWQAVYSALQSSLHKLY